MKKRLDTHALGLHDFTTYAGSLDPDSTLNAYFIEQDRIEGTINYDENYFWQHFDNKKYRAVCCQVVDRYLKEFFGALDGITYLGNVTMWSPREYNFEDDRFDFDVRINKRKLIKAFKENQESVIEFFKEHWSSRPGFHSFVKQGDEILPALMEGEENEIGIFLAFLTKDVDLDIDEFISDENANTGCFMYHEFIDDPTLSPEAEKLLEFLRENKDLHTAEPKMLEAAKTLKELGLVEITEYEKKNNYKP